tara:strand:- start:1628 stop:2356 length:729 start_codon:yes stop_codon:yes gene_type:complete
MKPTALHTPFDTALFPFAATGAGKTIMAVMSALIMLVNRDKWTDLKNEFMSIVYARRREQFSGLVCGGDIETMVLARLCIAYVPGTVLTHWYKTAESAVFGIKEIYPTANVQIWKGKNPHHSLKAAYDSGRPTLWLLPMEAASLDVETKWPNIAYGVRIMDELNVKMMKKYTGEVSCPLFTYIVRSRTAIHNSANLCGFSIILLTCVVCVRRPKRPSAPCRPARGACPVTRCARRLATILCP